MYGEGPRRKMFPRPKVSLRSLYWNEALRTGCLVGVLCTVPGNLTHYQWFSAAANIHIWTITWFTACLTSLHFLVSQGPLSVAAHGWFQNFIMLRDLHGLIGDERPSKTVTAEQVIVAGITTIVAVLASYYCTTRWSRPSATGLEGNERMDGPDKV